MIINHVVLENIVQLAQLHQQVVSLVHIQLFFEPLVEQLVQLDIIEHQLVCLHQ